MQAIRVAQFGEPEVLILQTVDKLEIQTATQVLVNLRAAGVNPVDTYIRAGACPNSPTPPAPMGQGSWWLWARPCGGCRWGIGCMAAGR